MNASRRPSQTSPPPADRSSRPVAAPILRPENVTALRRSGRLVFLDRSPEKLIATAGRPLASDREALRRRYEERYDLYCAAADLHIDGDGTVEETAQCIEKEWMK